MLRATLNRLLFLCVLQACINMPVDGQEPLMRHYTVNDGLPSTTLFGMLNDSKGFLWICSEAGVSRFDGQQFKNFTLADGLSDDEMLKVHEDSKGRVWFLGFNGTLSYFFNGKFYNPANDSVLAKSVSKTSFFYFFEDRLHRLWFTAQRDYVVIDGQNVKHLDFLKKGIFPGGTILNGNNDAIHILTLSKKPDPSLFTLQNDTFVSHKARYMKIGKGGFCYLPDGAILFSAGEGIVWQMDTIQKLVLPINTSVQINALLLTRANKLWIATIGDGLYCYDYNNLRKPLVRYLENKNTSNLCEDQEGNVWVSTLGDGLYMFPNGFTSVRNYNAANGLPGNEVFSVAKDEGNIYAGLNKGQVAIISRDLVKSFACSEITQPDNRVKKIIARGKNLWIASNDYLAFINLLNGSSCKMNSLLEEVGGLHLIGGVKDMCLNKDVLVASVSDYVYRSRGNALQDCSSPMERVNSERRRTYCVYIDHAGTTWYGAQGGLYSLRGKENVLHIPIDPDRDVRINSIAEIADSVLILATYGNGVYLYRNEKIIGHVSSESGLSSDICKRVFVHKNEVYIATNNGGTVLNYKGGKLLVTKKYTTAEGLLSNDVNDIVADDSEICIATGEGLSVINRYTSTDTFGAPPPIFLSAIRNSGRLLHPDSSYTFPYTQNTLRFEFIAISYRHAKDIRYQYKLTEGQQWVETGHNFLDFSFLEPGNYHFQLRARIADRPWSKTKSFHFVITPPFWETGWFFTAMALAFILLVWMIARYQIRSVKRRHSKELQIKDQVAQLEQQALQAMMNPHFIFNVMNSIQHYINNNEKHEANVYLSNFASLIRMNLDISSKRYISLDEEIAYLELYLSLESLRFGKRLTYKIDIDPAIDGDETMVPVMLLQPFIENAIWHGILPKKGDGHVQVSISKRADGMLTIQITDNGVGMPVTRETGAAKAQTHESKGLKITRHRLDLISEITGHTLYIHVNDAFPGEVYKGTKVELLLPGDLA